MLKHIACSPDLNNLAAIVSANEVLVSLRLLPVQENFLLNFQVKGTSAPHKIACSN